MPQLHIKYIDEMTYERMRVIADERGWSVDELAVRAIRYAIGLSSEHVTGQDRQDIATMRGVWNQSENLAFHEAMEAFRQVDSGPTFEAEDTSKDPDSNR